MCTHKKSCVHLRSQASIQLCLTVLRRFPQLDFSYSSVMGMQHSTPIPCLQDLEYFPSKEDLSSEHVLPILWNQCAPPGAKPGEIYGLILGRSRKRQRDNCDIINEESIQDIVCCSSFRPVTKIIQKRSSSVTSDSSSTSVSGDDNKSFSSASRKRRSSSSASRKFSNGSCFNGLQISAPTRTIRQTMVLYNVTATEAKSGIHAIIMRKPTLRIKAYQIFSPKPMHSNHQPQSKLVDLHKMHNVTMKLYLWGEVRQRNGSFQFVMTIFQPTGDVNYVSDECGLIFNPLRQLSISQNDGEQTCAYFKQHQREWELFVGPGVCPLLMLCYAACISQYY